MKRFYQWSLVLGMCLAVAPVAFAKDHDRDNHRDKERREWREHRRERDWRADRERREHRRREYARRHRDWDGDRRPPGWDKGRKEGWHGGDMPPGLAKKYPDADHHYRDHRYHPVASPAPVQKPQPKPVIIPQRQPKPHSTSPIVFPTNKQPANTQSH
jgi:hypothetical protein